MLDELFLPLFVWFADTSETQAFFIVCGLILFGALVGGFVLPGLSQPLARSDYFFRFAAGNFALVAMAFLFLLAIPALKLGIAFLLPTAMLLGFVAFGAWTAVISRARSVDGWGSGVNAWMGFIPILTLVLLFKGSREPDPKHGSAAAAWAGLVLTVLGFAVERNSDRVFEKLDHDLQNDAEAVVLLSGYRMAANGVESALDELILAEAAPREVFPNLLMASVTRDGSELTYAFVIDEPGITSLNPEFAREFRSLLCGSLMPYLRAGANAVLQFQRPDGLELEIMPLDLRECTA